MRHFVVVDDPVPGGLETVNRDLATASATLPGVMPTRFLSRSLPPSGRPFVGCCGASYNFV